MTKSTLRQLARMNDLPIWRLVDLSIHLTTWLRFCESINLLPRELFLLLCAEQVDVATNQVQTVRGNAALASALSIG